MFSFTRSRSRLRIKKIPGAGAALKQAGSESLAKITVGTAVLLED